MIYRSDLRSLIMRALQALDDGNTIEFATLRERIRKGELKQVGDEAGDYLMLDMNPSEWKDLTSKVLGHLSSHINDEQEAFGVEKNGYCLLISVLLEIDRLGQVDGVDRPARTQP